MSLSDKHRTKFTDILKWLHTWNMS